MIDYKMEHYTVMNDASSFSAYCLPFLCAIMFLNERLVFNDVISRDGHCAMTNTNEDATLLSCI